MKIVLALSSGGSRGIAHIGVIEELKAAGLEIVAVAGSSVGSSIGAFHAAGLLPEFKDWITRIDKTDVFKLMDFTFNKQGFIKGERLFSELEKMFGDRMIEHLEIPYTAVAVDIKKREEVWLTKGSMLEAVRASCATPSIMTPIKINNRELMDGGILNPLPIEPLLKYPHDMMVISNVNGNFPYKSVRQPVEEKKEQEKQYDSKIDLFWKRWKEYLPTTKSKQQEEKLSVFGLMNASVELLEERVIDLSLQKHQPHLRIEMSRKAAGFFDFYRAQEMIEYGRKCARKALKNYNLNKQTV